MLYFKRKIRLKGPIKFYIICLMFYSFYKLIPNIKIINKTNFKKNLNKLK